MDLFLLTAKIRRDFPLPREPEPFRPRSAAVMVVLYSKSRRAHVLMIKRAAHLKLHPGEISFPGGMFREDDGTLLNAALRETFEELQLEIPGDSVVGRLSAVVTRTGFEVTPFLALLDAPPQYEENKEEVEMALEIPLVPLLATERRQAGHKPSEEMFAYWFQKRRVWGASARILREIAALAERPD